MASSTISLPGQSSPGAHVRSACETHRGDDDLQLVARGVTYALLLAVPFWLAVAVLIWLWTS